MASCQTGWLGGNLEGNLLDLGPQTELSDQPGIRYIRNHPRNSFLGFLKHSEHIRSPETVSADLFPKFSFLDPCVQRFVSLHCNCNDSPPPCAASHGVPTVNNLNWR